MSPVAGLSPQRRRNEVGRGARLGIDVEHLTGAEIDHQKRASVRMEAEAQEKTGRSVDRQGSEQAPIVIKDEDLFRTVERGDIDVAVWRDGEALGERAPIRQYREKLRYITVECRCRVGLAKEILSDRHRAMWRS